MRIEKTGLSFLLALVVAFPSLANASIEPFSARFTFQDQKTQLKKYLRDLDSPYTPRTLPQDEQEEELNEKEQAEQLRQLNQAQLDLAAGNEEKLDVELDKELIKDFNELTTEVRKAYEQFRAAAQASAKLEEEAAKAFKAIQQAIKEGAGDDEIKKLQEALVEKAQQIPDSQKKAQKLFGEVKKRFEDGDLKEEMMEIGKEIIKPVVGTIVKKLDVEDEGEAAIMIAAGPTGFVVFATTVEEAEKGNIAPKLAIAIIIEADGTYTATLMTPKKKEQQQKQQKKKLESGDKNA